MYMYVCDMDNSHKASFSCQLVYHCKNLSVILSDFGYVSCNVHKIAIYFETQKLFEAMKIVLCMPVE